MLFGFGGLSLFATSIHVRASWTMVWLASRQPICFACEILIKRHPELVSGSRQVL
jgi:hypothetical protein